MNSDPPSAGPSSAPDSTAGPDPEAKPAGSAPADPAIAELVEERGRELLEALELHLPGSLEHANGTASYALAAAVEVGLDRAQVEAVRETARLHDVGRVYVPAEVLARPEGELGSEERARLDSHQVYGAQLARGAGIPAEACEWIQAARERFDGGGPTGLRGEEIALESRIIRAACAHDGLLATLPAAGSPTELHGTAAERLRAQAGRELDPRVVDALLAMLGRVL